MTEAQIPKYESYSPILRYPGAFLEGLIWAYVATISLKKQAGIPLGAAGGLAILRGWNYSRAPKTENESIQATFPEDESRKSKEMRELEVAQGLYYLGLVTGIASGVLTP